MKNRDMEETQKETRFLCFYKFSLASMMCIFMFALLFYKSTTFVTPCLCCWLKNPFKQGVHSEKKNLLPREQIISRADP